MTRVTRRGRAVALAALATVIGLTTSSCGFGGVYNTPLPGGADLGSHPITISANFHDALDLVPQSAVKVDDVAVGRVSAITLNPGARTAHVVLKVNSDVHLPVGTTARLQQTSLLGEKYVALIRPASGVQGADLTSGAVLGLNDTSQSAQVEQVLGALSLILNGGDIGQFQEISRELQHVSTGRSGRIKAFLTQLNGFVTGLDRRKSAITTALDSLDGLSTTLDDDKAKIATALDGLSPGLATLDRQRPQFVAMLKALNRLSTVTVDTLHKSQEATIEDLKALDPILAQLAKAGSDLPNALQILLTYPFPDSVLEAIKGDYMNVFLTTNFKTLPANCSANACNWPQVAGRMVASVGLGRHDAAPSLLPPTSSPVPGSPTPTLTVPVSPSASPFASSPASPSTLPSVTGSPSTSSPTPSVPSSTSGSGSGPSHSSSHSSSHTEGAN